MKFICLDTDENYAFVGKTLTEAYTEAAESLDDHNIDRFDFYEIGEPLKVNLSVEVVTKSKVTVEKG